MLDINKLIMEAMKSHNKVASETYKLLKAKMLEFKTAKNAREYNDAEEINIIRKMIDERKATIGIYNNNNRPDLADEELKQMNVLQELLPELPTEDDVKEWISTNYPNGVDKKEIGWVIKKIKDDLIGADGKMVADIVKKNIK